MFLCALDEGIGGGKRSVLVAFVLIVAHEARLINTRAAPYCGTALVRKMC